MTQLTPNFSTDELDCPCCGECNMSSGFINQLQYLRDLIKRPLRINSAFRCDKHNSEIGGAKNSRHLAGEAVDISYGPLSSKDRRFLISMALDMFDGVGIGSTFIHVDTRGGEKALWFYSKE